MKADQSDPINPNDPTNPNDNQDLQAPDDVKHQKAKPPSVTGEEDAFSGDMPSESPDIDEELEKVGLASDKAGVKPLGVTDELDEYQKAKEEEEAA